VEPSRQSRPCHDPVELYSQASSPQVWLQNYAVTVLAGADRVLAIQMVIGLKGLESLKNLTVTEYHKAGRLAGLEGRFVQDSVRLGSVSSGLSQSEVLSVLLHLCSDDGKPQIKDLSAICADICSSTSRKISDAQVNRAARFEKLAARTARRITGYNAFSNVSPMGGPRDGIHRRRTVQRLCY
jgi:hypothetical protein